ncbi:MAG: UDP-N-acetylmuramoyl-tripeptide--D-alanyl-D-alanine ligase [Treponema sp.]|jgi:UDP-N-acetylmuramoyl-tripeptide--D-alanyl-D-alanine ligase|nr:UDP-N-acetylmuramoyl-tripeptide--D-alanyl-D-alanine ligase [Treponema sp.]
MDLLMDYRSAAAALGAELFPPGAGGGFSRVVIDSRKAEPGALFIALKGGKSDGHTYLSQAFERGASAALVSEAGMKAAGFDREGTPAGEVVLLVVPDTLKGLQDLAGAYLDKFPRLLRIGITGSSGKTTVKEITAAVMGREKRVVMNQGNLNSETGLPLSLFEVRSHHEAGIFEAGMNRKGEIAELAAALKPHIALITNIGPAHIGILGSLEAIAQEKKDLFSQFTGNETALIPEDDPFRDYLAGDIRGRVVFYGQKNLEAGGKLNAAVDRGLEGTEIVWEGISAAFGLPGKHNLKNALAAAAIACEAGIGGKALREGLGSVKGLFGRSEILRGKTTVIRDCYNANPDSAAQALDFCDGADWPGRRVYIMGSMLELGAHSASAHGGLGERLLRSRGDMIFLYGKETAPARDVLKAGKRLFFYTEAMDELERAVSAYVRSGDLVLLKGSRGCALEGLTDTVLIKEGGAGVS